MRPLLLVLGVAIAAGAETHADMVPLIAQSLIGLSLVWLALSGEGNR